MLKLTSQLYSIIVFVIAQSCALQVSTLLAQSRTDSPAHSNAARYSSTSLEFIPNRGQLADQFGKPMPEVLYTLDGHGVKFYLTTIGLHYIFSRTLIGTVSSKQFPSSAGLKEIRSKFRDRSNDTLVLYRMDMEFIGANPHAWIEPRVQADAYSNFFLAQCPNGITHVPGFKKLLYHELYPRIDMELNCTADGGMEYEFIVHRGGNPNLIRMQYAGDDSISIQKGKLHISNSLGHIDEEAPYSYQITEDSKEQSDTTVIPSRFYQQGSWIGFVIGKCNPSKTLVIDPQRLWGTYYGGDKDDRLNAVAIDPSDNILAVGSTQSTVGIATTGSYQTSLRGQEDVCVAKFNSGGALIWSTYYGGNSNDEGYGIACDKHSNAYITGKTNSTTGIATTGAHSTVNAGQAIFLAKFDSTGSLVWGTYYGGGSHYPNCGFGVAVDLHGNPVVVGSATDSSGIATTGAHKTLHNPNDQDGAIAKFTNDGALVWGTFFGGTSSDFCQGVTIDKSGKIGICGFTQSISGIASTGTFQPSVGPGLQVGGFAALFDSIGNFKWGTYLEGDTSFENIAGAEGIAADSLSNLYVSGYTYCPRGFGSAGAYQSLNPGGFFSGFLEKLDTSGNRLWGTYYHNYEIAAVCVDSANAAFVSGGYGIGMLANFDSSGVLNWNTTYGAWSDSRGYGVAMDHERNVVIAGLTQSPTDIATSWASQSSYGGGSYDGFVMKYCKTVRAAIVTTASQSICSAQPDTLSASTGFQSYQWYLNGISIAGATNRRYAVPLTLLPGTYIYTVGVIDGFACEVGTDTIHLVVLQPPSIALVRDTSVCQHSSIRIGDTANGSARPFIYRWSPQTGLDHPDSARPYATPASATKYFVTVTDARGCQVTDSVLLHIRSHPALTAGGNKSVCLGTGVSIGGDASGTSAPYTYFWSPPTGLDRTDQAHVTASPTVKTTYTVIVTDKFGCQAYDTVVVSINPLPTLSLLDNSTCPGSPVVIGATATGGTPPYTYLWTPNYGLDDPTKATPTSTVNGRTQYLVTVTDANGCTATGTVTVSVFDPPTPVIFPGRLTLYCASDSTTLTAPAGFISYRWSNGQKTPVITAGAGIYTVTVTDVNGCTGVSPTVVVNQVQTPLPVVTGPLSECPNATGVYTSLDSNIATYTWTLSGGGTIAAGQSTNKLSINWQNAGSWRLSLKETMIYGGCEMDTTLTITVDKDLHPQITSSGPATICTGDSVTLSAAAGYDSYRWSTGATTPVLRIGKTGDYSVIVTNKSGCSGTSAITHVTVLPDSVPQPVLAAASTIICVGDSIALSTTKSYSSYLWSTGAATPSIYVSKAGSYFVTVQNGVGCSGTSKPMVFTVFARPVVQITPSGATTFCEGDSVMLSATAGYHYAWTRDAATLAETVATIYAKMPGSYYVTATNDAGCSTASQALAVTVKPTPHPVITGPSSICINGVSGYRISSPAGSNILWQVTPASLGAIVQGQSTDSVTVQWGAQGTATLAVSVTANGCTGRAQVPITIDSHLTPTVSNATPLSFCPGGKVTLDAGTGYQSYQWSKDGTKILGGTNETLTTSQSGSYSVFVTNASGCNGSSVASVVTAYPAPAKPTIVRNGKQLTSSPSAAYGWTFNGSPLAATGQSIAVAQDGIYIVAITDANGCTATSDPYNFSNAGSATVMLAPVNRANPGAQVTVPLTLVSSNNLLGSGVTTYLALIHFNASMLAPQGLASLGAVTNGVRTVTVTGNVTQPTGLLQNLNFLATLGDDTCTDLVIDTFYFPNANVDVTRENGSFCLSGVCIADGQLRLLDPNTRLTLSEAHPNPASESVSFSFQLAEEGHTRLYLMDALGRTALVMKDETMKPGSYTQTASTTTLASGAYRCILVTPSSTLVRRLEVVK